MGRRCAYRSGVVLVLVAVVAVPSAPVISSYVGGSAVHGHVEGGRYFVNPSHGRPVVEVSESTWRAVYWVERVWPFSAFVPGLAGLLLVEWGKGPNPTPAPVPAAPPPPWVLWLCLAAAWVTLGGAGLCWYATRAPWAVMLVGWVLACVCGVAVGGLYARSLRRPSAAEPDAAPEPGRR